MDEIDYRVSNNRKENRIGISIKRPKDINKKWSESNVSIKCAECGSKDLRTDLSGDMLVIACMDCPNYWDGLVDKVIGCYDTEEAYAHILRVNQFDKVPRKEREDLI